MVTLTNRIASVKPSTRTVVKPVTTRTLRYNAATSTLALTITTGRRVLETAYSVEKIGSDFGDGFALTKHVGNPADQCETYHVHLSDEGHACDCMGNLRWQRCKHVDALVKCRDLGTI